MQSATYLPALFCKLALSHRAFDLRTLRISYDSDFSPCALCAYTPRGVSLYACTLDKKQIEQNTQYAPKRIRK